MKLKKDYITYLIGGEQIIVGIGSAEFKGFVRSNKTAAFIVDCLKEDTTKEKIVSAMLEKYKVDAADASEDVDQIIEQLRSIGAIDD